MEVVGRHDELRAIAAWLERGPEDVLLIEGEAGIGKTTVWRAALEGAAEGGYTLLKSRSAPTEAQLSLAALRDLLDEQFDEIADALPAPQRHALAVALLREAPSGGSPDPGVVGASLLSALRTLAARRLTVIALDDVQWLDNASRGLLRFALRRITPGTGRVLVTRRIDEQPVVGRVPPPLARATPSWEGRSRAARAPFASDEGSVKLGNGGRMP